ncbi:hypothetical protein [Nocardia sp. SC052]|uniref:hypothetical protein n=1 Tax=Nocardia sichangensis TaxID=3385975 RepID=UPI00399F0F83
MDVRDSSGVRLTDYVFATNHGGLFHPMDTVMSGVLGLEFVGYIVLVTTAVWLIGYAVSFQWLDPFGRALTGVADNLTGQIATPLTLVTAAAIGAFFVAWFIVRGQPAKATMQIVAMVGVALLGPVFLAEPLGDVLSSHGLLAQGRDLGIAVAAGLNGNSDANPRQVVATMQGDLADNFARRPLQVWNFGHVVDESPRCANAWSAGVRSGDDSRVIDGMRACGDIAAHDEANDPSWAQVGSGLVLLLCGMILLLFGAYLAIKIVWAAMDSIYHGFMAIFGFAAGGFIYGPTQTFLIRNLVDGFVAAGRMAAYTIFLGVYVLFLGNLFQQAQGQVMVVLVLGAIVEIIAILQLRRLARSLSHGNDWIANRFALAMQTGGSSKGAGAGGGTALGMGTMGASQSMSGIKMMALMGGLSTVANSPLTEWALGGVQGSFRPGARRRDRMSRMQSGFWNSPGIGGPGGTYAQSYMKFRQFVMGAREAAMEFGGRNTYRGAAAALRGVKDFGGTRADFLGALRGARFTDDRIMALSTLARGIVDDNSEDETLGDKHLGHVVAAVQEAQRQAYRLVNGHGSAEEVAASFGALEQDALVFRRANYGGVRLDGGADWGPERAIVTDYMNNPTREKIIALREVRDGVHTSTAPAPAHATTRMLTGIDADQAGRMMDWIGNEHAYQLDDAVKALMRDPTNQQLLRNVRMQAVRATDTDQWVSGAPRTPWNNLAPPDSRTVLDPNRWARRMAGVERLLR